MSSSKGFYVACRIGGGGSGGNERFGAKLEQDESWEEKCMEAVRERVFDVGGKGSCEFLYLFGSESLDRNFIVDFPLVHNFSVLKIYTIESIWIGLVL